MSGSSAFVLSRAFHPALVAVVGWAFAFYLYLALCIRRRLLCVSTVFFHGLFHAIVFMRTWLLGSCTVFLVIIPILNWHQQQIHVLHHCDREESNNSLTMIMMVMMMMAATSGSQNGIVNKTHSFTFRTSFFLMFYFGTDIIQLYIQWNWKFENKCNNCELSKGIENIIMKWIIVSVFGVRMEEKMQYPWKITIKSLKNIFSALYSRLSLFTYLHKMELNF